MTEESPQGGEEGLLGPSQREKGEGAEGKRWEPSEEEIEVAESSREVLDLVRALMEHSSKERDAIRQSIIESLKAQNLRLRAELGAIRFQVNQVCDFHRASMPNPYYLQEVVNQPSEDVLNRMMKELREGDAA